MKKTGFRWFVYYGDHLASRDLAGVDLAVTDPDNISPNKIGRKGPARFIAYLSVGEINQTRPYWQRVADEGLIAEPNPHWEGAYRVDVRSKAWKKLILDEIVPSLLLRGYDGVFLDTVDVASYLESLDPARYAGSRAAMIRLIGALRKKFPKLLIYPNNGFDMLAEIESAVDGVFVEDVYTRYDFAMKQYIPTPHETTLMKEKILDAFKARMGKPVFTILYSESSRTPLALESIARCRKKGYEWYLTTADLMKLGTLAD